MRRALVLCVLWTALVATSALARPATTLPGFRSPSRNISCLFVPASGGGSSRLLCSIAHATYVKTLQNRCMAPTGGGVDWHGFELTPTRMGAVVCSGGILYSPATQHPRYVTLPYGRTWRQGVFTCQSRVTGITCRSRTGHGLFTSRGSWKAW
jgi:hypothetical protein